MADKIVVLNGGRIEQVGTPLELYEHPANLFVAGFIGSPRMNLVDTPADMDGGAKTIGVRPEDIDVSRENGAWQGKVSIAEHLGSDTFFYIDAEPIGRLTVRTPGEFSLRAGESVWLTPKAGSYSSLRRQRHGDLTDRMRTGRATCPGPGAGGGNWMN